MNNLMTPKQKKIYEEYKATFDEELEVLQRRKKLILGWKELRTEEILKTVRKNNRVKKE